MRRYERAAFYADLRTVILVYVIIVAVWAFASYLFSQDQPKLVCGHPVDMQRIDTEYYEYLTTGEVIVCELCGRKLAVERPAVYAYHSYEASYAKRLAQHENYVSRVRESIAACETPSTIIKAEDMSGVGYAYPDRQHVAGDKAYLGATSSGHGWEIRWKGPYNEGPTAIDAMRAVRDHLSHLQQTTSTSESNAKLLFHVLKAIEEYDGEEPSIGGSLNDLIPKAEPSVSSEPE
jgi:hypothetical protein